MRFHNVGAVYMNRPWLYAGEIVRLFRNERWTVEGLRRRLREDFPILSEIEDICEARRIPIYEALTASSPGRYRRE
jgi:hypothetical protein